MAMARQFALLVQGVHEEDDDREFNKLYDGFLDALANCGYKVTEASADWEHGRLHDRTYREEQAKNPVVKRSYREGASPDIIVQPPPAGAGSATGPKPKRSNKK